MALFVFHKNIVHKWILNKTFFISSSEISFQRNNFHFFYITGHCSLSSSNSDSRSDIEAFWRFVKPKHVSVNLLILVDNFFTPYVLFKLFNSLRTVLFFVDLASVGYSYADTTVWPASFPVCAGQQQSPIDLLSSISSETTHEAFQFTHHTDSITENMTNTGHSCKTNSLKITYFATHSKSHSKYRM